MKAVLDNGVTIVTESMPYLRSATFGVWVAGGSAADPDASQGIAHFAEHMAFKGTQARTSEQIAQQFDMIGGYVNAFTAKEVTCYYAKTLDTHIEQGMDLLADMVLNPAYAPDETETEKKVILEEISMYEDSPEDLVMGQLTENVWAGQALGREILGTEQTVSGVGSKTLRQYADQFYTGKRIFMSVSGKVDEQRFIRVCEDLFASRAPGAALAERPQTQYRKSTILTQKDIEQNHICIGYRGFDMFDPRKYAVSIFSSLLGGGMSSRLFRKIREDAGLAYTVQSYGTSYRDAGIFCIYTALAPKSEKECLELIRRELDAVKKDGFTEDEIARAKEQLKAGIIMDLENTASRMKFLAKREIYGGGERNSDEIVKKVDAVTADDVQAVANELIDHENVSVSVVGKVRDESFYTGYFS